AIGDGPDAAGWDAKHKLAFASSGDGILAVVDTSKPGFPTIESLPTQRGARTMAYDAGMDRVYLVTAEFGPKPAAPTADNPRQRPPMIPVHFALLAAGRYPANNRHSSQPTSRTAVSNPLPAVRPFGTTSPPSRLRNFIRLPVTIPLREPSQRHARIFCPCQVF